MWRVEFEPDRGRLTVHLRDHVSTAQARDLAEAHARALEATGSAPFRVLLDLRGLFPLESDAVVLVGAIKQLASQAPGWRGTAVLTDSPTVTMQQRRTMICDHTDPGRELVTQDPAQAERFLTGTPS